MTASNYEDSPEELGLRQTVGAELRLHREERGLEIRDVVEAVRIQARYLEALEDGRVQDLPGTVYALGFVRTYAEFLGLDGTEMVSRFKEEARGLQSQQYVLPEPIDEGKVPTAAIIIIAILLAGVAYGAYHFLYAYDRDLAREVPDVPERLADLVPPEEEVAPPAGPAPVAPKSAETVLPDVVPGPADDTSTVAPPSPPAQEQLARQVPPAEPLPPPAVTAPGPPPQTISPPPAPAAPQPPEPRPAEVATAPPTAPTQATGDSAPPPAVPSDTPAPETESAAAVAPPPPPVAPVAREPRVYGADNVTSRVVIRAIEDAWVEVTDTEGALLFSRVLRRGDSYRVPERPGAVFVTGNAGGLEILVDGERAPAIGPAGMVRRNVRLDPDQLKAGTAWP